MKKQCIPLSGSSPMPFSAAVKAGCFIFVSGQVGSKDDKGNDIKGIEGQLKQCMDSIKKTLEKADSSLKDVVKVTVFLRNVEDFPKLNEIYSTYFPTDRPARSTAITGLVNASMLVEIECIAYCPDK